MIPTCRILLFTVHFSLFTFHLVCSVRLCDHKFGRRRIDRLEEENETIHGMA